jgi:hypothetical protein
VSVQVVNLHLLPVLEYVKIRVFTADEGYLEVGIKGGVLSGSSATFAVSAREVPHEPEREEGDGGG